jgi:prevent-host-death family protein
MAQVYSAYEAKAKFSEVIRKVRAGQRIVIAYRGEEVAEIRPLETSTATLDKAIRRLEDRGVLAPSPRRRRRPWRPVARRAGALKRFLESRD